MFTEESIRQIVFLSGILAGFAFTIVTQLLSLKDERGIVSLVISCFLVTASLLLVATFVGSLVLVRLSGADSLETSTQISADFAARTDRAAAQMLIPLAFGLFTFLVGLALTGWIHSAKVGVLSTVCAIVAFILAFAILRPL
jgi:hypothetical protein